MSEILAIQFIEALTSRDVKRVKSMSSAEAIAGGSVLPGVVPLAQGLVLVTALWAALPDFHCEIMNIETYGDDVMIEFTWGGTHTGILLLPNRIAIAPTGKQVRVPDKFIFSFKDNHLIAVQIVSPAGGGIPGLMAQLNNETSQERGGHANADVDT